MRSSVLVLLWGFGGWDVFAPCRFHVRNTHDTSHSTIPHFIPYTLHSAFNTPLSSHSTRCTPPHSTLHSLHWYGKMGRIYKTVQIICFTTVFYVTVFGFVGCTCSIFFVINQSKSSHVCVTKAIELPPEVARGAQPLMWMFGAKIPLKPLDF